MPQSVQWNQLFRLLQPSTVQAASYLAACVYDACAAQSSGTGLVLACRQSYGAYEAACSAAGVQGVVSVIDSCGVCFGNGSSCTSDRAIRSAFCEALFLTVDGKLGL